jgi:hypothetical protein
LLYRDHGEPLQNPVSPDPIYQMRDSIFVILYHDNPGGAVAGAPSTAKPRRPLYLSVGEFRPDADQPVWFSDPQLFMETDGVTVDGSTGENDDGLRNGLLMCSSFTTHGGEDVLWYPDRKFFLLGKQITSDLIDDIEVPER